MRLLDIDWAKVNLTSDADALALWQRIAPTGADWDDKLQEIPPALAPRLAAALLRSGNLTCAPPPAGDCSKPLYDVPAPADTAGLADPCLRRLLALWSINQLDDDELPGTWTSLLAIAAIPPPESQLVDAAIHALPEADQSARLDLLAAAWRAGQHELVDASVGPLDEAHLIEAVRRHHIGGALEVLSVEAQRAVYIAAVTDEALPTRPRTMAITELGALAALDGKLPADLRAALLTAVTSKDCSVAAAAVRVLEQRGDHRFVPRRPHTSSVGSLMRAMCVLASYEALQRSDEASLLPTYLPARGLARITITSDPLSDVDSDGDGDPHTERTEELVPRGDAVLPELEDVIRAMLHCTGAICSSEDREIRFVWARADLLDSGPQRRRAFGGELLLSRIELADRPPCAAAPASKR